MRDLNGKVALITGASAGIGYVSAVAFARRGVHVAVTARDVERLRALESEIAALPAPHGELLAIGADVRDTTSMQSVVSQTVTRFGRLDILVANAGIGQRGALVDATWNDLDTVLRTNLDGVLHSVRAAVPEMRKQGGGHIVIISSVVATMITPYTAIYSASKAAVSSLARSLRYELESEQIGVSDLLVGRTGTAFNENRLGAKGYSARAPRLPVMTPEFVAEAIVRAVEHNQGTVALRWFDRLVIWASAFVPHVVARRAARQYKT